MEVYVKFGTITSEPGSKFFTLKASSSADVAELTNRTCFTPKYSARSFYRFVYHDGALEALDDRKKINFLSVVRKICEDYKLQYILTIIDSDLPKDENGEVVDFPEDELSDKSERFFVSEIIREKILLNYYEEVPYSVEVQVEEFKEKEDITVIKTKIFVLRESQKNIIIGHKGEMIKKVGMQARKDIEQLLGTKVYLELFVKVRKGWRDDENMLKKFGYFE